jgi:hypothetical protein
MSKENPFEGYPDNGEIKKCPYGPGRLRYSRSHEMPDGTWAIAYPFGWYHIDPCEHILNYRKLVKDTATYLLALDESPANE